MATEDSQTAVQEEPLEAVKIEETLNARAILFINTTRYGVS